MSSFSDDPAKLSKGYEMKQEIRDIVVKKTELNPYYEFWTTF
jgi:hypothetical protein